MVRLRGAVRQRFERARMVCSLVGPEPDSSRWRLTRLTDTTEGHLGTETYVLLLGAGECPGRDQR